MALGSARVYRRGRALRLKGGAVSTTAAEVTAQDVAVELVATKIAILGVLESLAGTCPLDALEKGGYYEWSQASPVALPDDCEWRDEHLFGRSYQIEDELLIMAAAAIGNVAEARMAAHLRAKTK